MSGTARLAFEVSPFWNEGRLHTAEKPPPPAPGIGTGLVNPSAHAMVAPWQLFQTTWEEAGAPLGSLVPPALTTSGWDPGSSTARAVLCAGGLGKQSSDPESPEAAIMVWPCIAMRWKIWLSLGM